MNMTDYQKHRYVSPACETVNVEAKGFFCSSEPEASKQGYESYEWS